LFKVSGDMGSQITAMQAWSFDYISNHRFKLDANTVRNALNSVIENKFSRKRDGKTTDDLEIQDHQSHKQ
jgi:hypothetical protein